MEYPWRPAPQGGNLCPVCSNPHSPFCPHPIPQYYRPPLPPPDQFFYSPLPPLPPTQAPHPPQPPQPSYEPFVDLQGDPTINRHPPRVQILPRPWNPNPNYSKDHYGNSDPGLNYDNSVPVGVKRMRFNNVNGTYAGPWSEDERRLKLIRDHGAANHGLYRHCDGGRRLLIPDQSFDQSNLNGNRGNFGDHFQGIEGGYRLEIKSYGERQFVYKHIENNKNMELGRLLYNQSESNGLQNHGYEISSVHEEDRYKSFAPPGRMNETWLDDNSAYHEQRNNSSQTHSTQQHIMEPNWAYYGLPNQVQPPLPTSPPPLVPVDPPMFRLSESSVSSSAFVPSSVFPVAVDSASPIQSPYTKVSEAITSVSTPYPNSSGYYPTEFQAAKMASSNSFKGEGEKPSRGPSLDQPKVIDVSHILKHPHRANRPDHIVVILRGLPGSGKSYLAKMLRDLEVENGGSAPRIHSMDEYFMTEVEESEGSRSSGSFRGRKPVMKKVMEYCYEPEMEEAYRSSMLKAFKKTLDEGAFPFVIVDDRNLRVADFAQFWATGKRLPEAQRPAAWLPGKPSPLATGLQTIHPNPSQIPPKGSLKGISSGLGLPGSHAAGLSASGSLKPSRSGFEVYLLEAAYKDPAGCAARNVHGFTQNEIQKMANHWEEAPSLYMKLDIKSLLHGDGLEQHGIQEVDMDTEDDDYVDSPAGSEGTTIKNFGRPSDGNLARDDILKDDKKWDAAEVHQLEVVKELGKSKWSNELDEDELHKTEATRGNSTSLSSLIKSYSKKGKSVRWADQIGRIGFSIGAGKAANVSLIIGAGSGYNLMSNPLPEEEKFKQTSGGLRRKNVFQEQLRAEREAFRAVFDKRKQRINGLDADEE
ncbi:hypothetical protein OROGR_029351 [Orobanche gracilis]